MRSLSATARQAIFSSQTADVFVLLLTIGDGTIDPPIRVCSGGKDITSVGTLYRFAPFSFSLPDDVDTLPSVTLSIDNVDRSILQAVRELDGPIAVTMSIVLAAAPNTVEAGPFDFTLRGVTANALTVEGTLAFEDILNEPFPGDVMSPSVTPALF